VLAALAVAGFFGARDTSVFAVRRLQVVGAPPRVRAEVMKALRPELGTSLLRVDGAAIDRRLGPVADVASARYDRAFPHTLRIVVTPESPVAVLRQGARAWLASARGRVLRALAHPQLSGLPRIWLTKKVSLMLGATVADADTARALHALALTAGTGFLGRIRFVKSAPDELTFALSSGVELRLGDGGDMRLKLAIARRILHTGIPSGYVDVSVPERPVASTNPQVAGRG